MPPAEKKSGAAAETNDAARPTAKRVWPARLLKLLLGLVVGLGLAEAVFWWRDDRAFPHLNVYESDSELGVRLRPGAEQRIAFGGNPATDVAINASGFRGTDWPAAGSDDVLVVGDSQAFGLGVSYDESFSAKLQQQLKRTVLDAGVPTYGPLEYNHLLERLLPERKPKTVVLVVNLANDLFEAVRPNVERHKTWDGWAVRIETAPLEVRSFPLRSWLFNQSHLFFALRKLVYQTQHPALDDAAFPSEGGWQDIAAAGDTVSAERERRRHEFERLADLRRTEVLYAEQRALRAELELEKRFYEELRTTDFSLRAARANPGDITAVGPGEAGSPLAGTVKQIRAAIELRNRLEASLKELAKKAEKDKRELIEASFAGREREREALARLKAAPLAVVRSSSPLALRIEEAKKLCDAQKAELLVVALPLDVQISADEWKKYPNQEPVDVTGTEVLLTDIVEHARSLGARGLDASEALRAAEPGAFLHGDLHMSAKGHAALADAIAAALAEPPPPAPTTLEKGRSRIPAPAQWARRKEATVHGSTAANCVTKIYDEWLLVRCAKKRDGPKPLGVRVLSGAGLDALTMLWDDTMTLIAPRVRGRDLVADFFWEGERRRLTAPWPADQEIGDSMHLEKADGAPDGSAPAVDPSLADALCTCHKSLVKGGSCNQIMAAPDADCERTYGSDCERKLRCAEGDLAYKPRCADGFVNAGSLQHCQRVCSKDADCKGGHCRSWQSVKVCVAAE